MNFYWEYSTVTPRLDEDDEATAAAALVIYGHKLEHWNGGDFTVASAAWLGNNLPSTEFLNLFSSQATKNQRKSRNVVEEELSNQQHRRRAAASHTRHDIGTDTATTPEYVKEQSWLKILSEMKWNCSFVRKFSHEEQKNTEKESKSFTVRNIKNGLETRQMDLVPDLLAGWLWEIKPLF